MNSLMWDEASGQWHDLICTEMAATEAPAAGAVVGVPARETQLAGPPVLSPEAEAAAAAALQQVVCAVERNPAVLASNFLPLWAGVAEPGSAQAAAAVAALNASGLVQVAGVATTLTESGQQWDAPNSWPPLVWMLIDGAERNGEGGRGAKAEGMGASGTESSPSPHTAPCSSAFFLHQTLLIPAPGSFPPGSPTPRPGGAPGDELARQLADAYLATAFATYAETGANFEKFDAGQVGFAGGGGEYAVVEGFGWTNGAALDLLQRFGA